MKINADIRLVKLGACALLLCAGCSMFSSMFSSKAKIAKKKADEPAVLVPFANRIGLQRVWSVKLSGEAPKLRLGLDAAEGHLVEALFRGRRNGAARRDGRLLDLDLGRQIGNELLDRLVEVHREGGRRLGLRKRRDR